MAASRLGANTEANLEQDADSLRPQVPTATADAEILIDRSLAPAPEPRPYLDLWPDARYLTKASKASNVLVDAILSVFGLTVLIASTASVVFIMAIFEYKMSFFQAALPAGCAGLLSPVVVIVSIRLIDVMLRLAFLFVVAVLVTGLIELVQQALSGS